MIDGGETERLFHQFRWQDSSFYFEESLLLVGSEHVLYQGLIFHVDVSAMLGCDDFPFIKLYSLYRLVLACIFLMVFEYLRPYHGL